MGLLKGVHTFTLSPGDDGATSSPCRRYSPARFFLIHGRTIPDLNPSFKQFASSLKELAERSHG